MLGCRRSELAENAKLIRMNEKLAAQLHNLGKQMKALVTSIDGRMKSDTIKPNEDDHVPSAGC